MRKNKKNNASKEQENVENVNENELQMNNITNNKKIIILVCIIFAVLAIAILLIVLLTKGDKKSDNSKNDKKEDNTEIVDNIEYYDLKVDNLGSSKNYHIQLAKKDDGSYAYYDKDNKKLISDFDYENYTYNENSCVINSLYSETKVYSFEMNNKDYLYVYVSPYNKCKNDKYFIYNITDNEKVREGNNGTIYVTKYDEGIVISLMESSNNDCTEWTKGNRYSCDGKRGFLFVNDDEFKEVIGNYSWNTVNGDIFVDSNGKLTLYNKKGKVISEFDNMVSYNENYIITYDKSGMVVYDLKHNTIGTIDFFEYEKDKYYFSPRLEEDFNQLRLNYVLSNNSNEVKDIYFDLIKKKSINIEDKVDLVNISYEEASSAVYNFFNLGLMKRDWLIGFWSCGYENCITKDFSYLTITDKNSSDFYRKDSFSVNDLTKEELIKTALFNVDDNKKDCIEFNNTNKGSYTIEEINEVLSKYVHGKSLTLQDLIDYNSEELTIKDNKIYYKTACGGEDTVAPREHIIINNYKVERTNDSIIIYQKVAFSGKPKEENDYITTFDYYKDYNNKEYVESLRDQKRNISVDKYNTYKVTFKLIDGKYYFDNYQLIK